MEKSEIGNCSGKSLYQIEVDLEGKKLFFGPLAEPEGLYGISVFR